MPKTNLSEEVAIFVSYLKDDLSAEHFMGRNGESMIMIHEDGKKKSFDVESKLWRSWVHLRIRKLNLGPSKNRLDYIRDELIALAHESGDQRDIFIRVGGDEKNVYIDLGCSDFKSIHISPDGYEVKSQCPVTFLRPNKQIQLPLPAEYNVKDFLRLFKKWYLGSSDYWPLLLVFILQSLHRNGGAFVFLVLGGLKDSGKSFLTGRIKSLIDPSIPLLIKAPKDDENLVVASKNSYLFAFDNVSGISNSLADTFCSLSTGGGISSRKLYTNHEEASYLLHNPCIFNGINDPSPRSDFLDRVVTIELSSISNADRIPLSILQNEFQKDYPCLLGGLYGLLSKCLSVLPTVQTSNLPRMADYARMGIAMEIVTGLKAGSFLKLYEKNLKHELEKAFESNEMCCAIYRYLDRHGEVSGTADELRQKIFGRSSRDMRGWIPNSAAHFGYELKRADDLLRLKGILIEKSARTASVRAVYTIRWEDPEAHPPTASSSIRRSTFKVNGAAHEV